MNTGALGITQSDPLTGSGAEPYASPAQNTTVSGDEGNNILYIEDREVAVGDAGDDSFIISSNGYHAISQQFTIDDFEEGETISLAAFAGADSAADINLSSGSISLYGGRVSIFGSSFTTAQIIYNTTLHDAISGTAYDNYLFGGAGDDTISGLDGQDTLIGGDGIAANDNRRMFGLARAA